MMKYLFVYTCVDMFVCLYLYAWAMKHFTKLYPSNANAYYECYFPCANRFVATSGHASTSHY